MIRLEDFGGGPPALTAELLKMDAGDVAVLAVSRVETVEVPQSGDKPRNVLVVRFKERPDHAYYCNKTSLKRLVAGYGDDETKWIGKSVPLLATDQINPNSGEATTSLWVADPKSWSKHVKGYKKVSAKARR